jgi:3'-phosphoadenosine 5'-phosphosulfate (PAPS) 3'-phosphatase
MKLVENLGDVHFSDAKGACGTWDICAPQAILEAAGGYMNYLNGEKIEYTGQRKLNRHFIATRTRDHMDYMLENLPSLI